MVLHVEVKLYDSVLDGVLVELVFVLKQDEFFVQVYGLMEVEDNLVIERFFFDELRELVLGQVEVQKEVIKYVQGLESRIHSIAQVPTIGNHDPIHYRWKQTQQGDAG